MKEEQLLHQEIEASRNRLGKKLLILGHHYQRDEVIQHADLLGDSFQLSKAASELVIGDCLDCETIVFCGVHFMAETADLLANSPENLQRRGGRRVKVVMPDDRAGCPMADMASWDAVLRCRNLLSQIIDVDDLVPVAYVNSSAELKAFCGTYGGIACTSGNARSVLDRAFSQKRRVLFFPDQHLGRNTAVEMGIPETAMSLWTDNAPEYGGNTAETIRNSKMILWDGFCCIHQRIQTEWVDAVRKEHPEIRVIVHPECPREIVIRADESGSTSQILRRITQSPPGTKWAVGTESRFVERLARQNPDKTVVDLSPMNYCRSMSLTNLDNLSKLLRSVESGTPYNIISVDESIAPDALICLRRMLQCR